MAHGDPFLDDFVSKVRSGEYVIHEDAQKMKLEGGTLAYMLGEKMAEYEEAKKQDRSIRDAVYSMTLKQLVNLAFSHNLVRNGEALYKRIRTLESQLATLSSQNWELKQEAKRMFSVCPKCHYKSDDGSLTRRSKKRDKKRSR